MQTRIIREKYTLCAVELVYSVGQAYRSFENESALNHLYNYQKLTFSLGVPINHTVPNFMEICQLAFSRQLSHKLYYV